MWMDQEHTAATAAAKSLQSCPTLCDPTDDSPPGSPIPGILQARTLEWVASILRLVKCQRKTNTVWYQPYGKSKKYRWIYAQNRNTDTEDKLVITSKREGGRGNIGIEKRGYYEIIWNCVCETLKIAKHYRI